MAVGKILPIRNIQFRIPRGIAPRVPTSPFRAPNIPGTSPTNFGRFFQADWVFDTDVRRLNRVSNVVNKKIDGAYMYIGKAIRQRARTSIKKKLKSQPHSRPGEPVRSRTRILPDTIYRYYNPREKTLLVGPKKENRPPARDKSKPIQNPSVPNLLEYGGTIHAPEPTYIARQYADPRAVRAYWKKERYRRYGGKRKPRNRKAFKLKDVKYIVIPPGYRVVDPRPTMRLAFNRVVTFQSLKYAFDRIGVSDPGSLSNDISGLRI